MAKDSSFDVVSQVDMQEMDNAVNQTKKEIAQRYDFRGSDASIELEEKCIKLAAEDEYKLNAIIDILRARIIDPGEVPVHSHLHKIEKVETPSPPLTPRMFELAPSAELQTTRIRDHEFVDTTAISLSSAQPESLPDCGSESGLSALNEGSLSAMALEIILSRVVF